MCKGCAHILAHPLHIPRTSFWKSHSPSGNRSHILFFPFFHACAYKNYIRTNGGKRMCGHLASILGAGHPIFVRYFWSRKRYFWSRKRYFWSRRDEFWISCTPFWRMCGGCAGDVRGCALDLPGATLFFFTAASHRNTVCQISRRNVHLFCVYSSMGRNIEYSLVFLGGRLRQGGSILPSGGKYF